jgi:TetR/AcrR family transcriptional regulator
MNSVTGRGRKTKAAASAATLPASRHRGRDVARKVHEPNAVPAVEDRAERPSRKAPRGSDVRARVLRVALEHFGNFGFEGTSTRAVAEAARITHTLVLYHFKSKDQLWIATLEYALAAYATTTALNFSTAHTRPAKEVLTTFIDQFVRMSAAQPHVHRLMTMEGNQDSKRIQWIIDHFLRQHFATVRDLIRRGQAEGTIRQCDPARLYYLIIGAGGTPFTLRTEYRALTGRDVFSEAEILRNIAFIYEIVFTE